MKKSRTKSKRKKPSKRSSRGNGRKTASPALFDGLIRPQLHDLLRHMMRTRAIEDRLVALYKQGRLFGALFRSMGQEATAVGSAYALEEGDVLSPLIRDLGASLVTGFTARDVFAQYMCKADSTCAGRDGLHHLGDMKRGVLSLISMLGSGIAVAAGVAWSRNRQGGRSVALTYIGDGGTSTGEFHEAMNLAAVLNLPLVLIIENNGWAYSTPVDQQTRVRDLAVRAQGYGIPGYIVDGNDPIDVYRVTRKAVEDARAGKGPSLIESKTYRIRGHAEHDPATYVPPEVREEWVKRDPIETFRARLRRYGMLTEEEEQAIREAIELEIHEGEAEVRDLPLPPGHQVSNGVFADESVVRFTPWWEKH